MKNLQQTLTQLEQKLGNDQFLSLANTHINVKLAQSIGSHTSFILSNYFKKSEIPFLFILSDKEEAAYYLNDLERFIGEDRVLFFPGSYKRPYQVEETDNANVLLRSEVLNQINSRKKPSFIVTYPDALFEKVVTKAALKRNTLKVAVGDALEVSFVNEVLYEYHFNRVDFVTEPGEFSVRGGIIDVFSFSNDVPYRIEFFGDEVDSIRTFDVETQLSTEKVKKMSLMANVGAKHISEQRVSFLEYISSKTMLFMKNEELLLYRLDALFQKATNLFENIESPVDISTPDMLFCNGNLIKQQLEKLHRVQIDSSSKNELPTITFQTKPQPSFNKQFDLLIQNLQENTEQGIENYLFCDSGKQAKRFKDIFEDIDEKVQYKTVICPIYKGFIDQDAKVACYTDHQIFERYHKFRLKNGYAKKQSLTLKEITRLEIGDYVTHIDHGIGKFGGLHKIEVEGNKQEAIKLIYGENDILYIGIHSLHKIAKYNGKDGKAPKIYKLGSPAWKKLKQKTKARIKKIAYNLIELYAKRKIQKGYAFSPDSYMQNELEASFMYEDTPDQLLATQQVKQDMESEHPMDRLICGDVGFGKTEIAVRAAFKAVDNGKQVAILVPTTILAFQHYKTFSERLKEFPVTVDYLNRFRTPKQRKGVLEGIQNGTIDIVIGTHQLTNAKIKYKDLGLLIIDEEQKFGVAVKDKLKTIKENVDTLTLSATPIPRTLQFSLMAARDLSVIRTPPPNRHPIESNVIRFSEETLRDAIRYEMQRGGQVFFIHNRIDTIKEVAGMLQRLLPDAKIGIGHGQMDGKKLENLMLSFINNEFDVLVATTIIESGLDVPNANTIFINNANNFGLSDLHQMRGRVGRSNKKAFCYFITPPYHMMTDDARKRIQALEMFTELGSGFQISMKDLEIRGAGDLLGAEQSGFMNDIGFETYQKILNETIKDLKEKDFKEVYNTSQESIEYVSETQIDTDIELLFPDDYVSVIAQRLDLYRDLAAISKEKDLVVFEQQLMDRFGQLPISVVDLLDSVRLKWKAKEIGFERMIIKRNRMVGYFISDQQSDYYQSPLFTRVITFTQKNASCSMKEKNTSKGLKLLMTFENIASIQQANKILQDVLNV